MGSYKNLFTDYLCKQKLHYTDRGEHSVRVTYSGSHLPSIPVQVLFDQDDEPTVQLKCWDIASFLGKEAQGEQLCAKLNREFSWVRFYLDQDSDLVAAMDAYVDDYNCGELCLRLVLTVVDAADACYPLVEESLAL